MDAGIAADRAVANLDIDVSIGGGNAASVAGSAVATDRGPLDHQTAITFADPAPFAAGGAGIRRVIADHAIEYRQRVSVAVDSTPTRDIPTRGEVAGDDAVSNGKVFARENATA